MEKRKGRRVLYKFFATLLIALLLFIVVYGGIRSYFENSENIWFPIFQSVLFLGIIYLFLFKMINIFAFKMYSDTLYLFKKKEIKIVKETDNTYSIVKMCKNGKRFSKFKL